MKYLRFFNVNFKINAQEHVFLIHGTFVYTYKLKWFILETYKALYIVLLILSLHMQPPTIQRLLEYKLVRLRIRFFWNAAAYMRFTIKMTHITFDE